LLIGNRQVPDEDTAKTLSFRAIGLGRFLAHPTGGTEVLADPWKNILDLQDFLLRGFPDFSWAV